MIYGLTCSLAVLWVASISSVSVAREPERVPRIRISSGENPLEIASLETRVVIHGLHAETTQTITFFNPNRRVLEGDLEFPLPDGATVSGFGLDISGQLVDGVVVAKDQARVILETEIRRGVDPGLVEQVRGNIYRTRIYPIPARGTRTVRLRWVSSLTTKGEEAAYHLPLPYEKPIGDVSLKVEVVRAAVAPEVVGGFGNLTLQRWEDRYVAEARWTKAAPKRDLMVRLPNLPARLLHLEPGEGGEAFFSISDLLPQEKPAAIVAPRRMAIAWDASGSRDQESSDREIALVERLLSHWPNTAVDLVVFRDRCQPPVAFKAGDRKALIAALRSAAVDGGTGLAVLDLRRAALPHEKDDLWLLFTDGLGTLGESLPRLGDVPVWTVSGASLADRPLLRHVASVTGGEHVDLVALEEAAAVKVLTTASWRLLRIETPSSTSPSVEEVRVVPLSDRQRVVVTGRLLADEGEVALVFGVGQAVVEKRVIKLKRASATRAGNGKVGPVAVAWAQSQAEVLSLFPQRNSEALLGLGRRFGLVTANTSLLVLETLAQYLEHKVEPPSSLPQIRKEYLAQVVGDSLKKEKNSQARLEEVVRLWNERVRWWQKEFTVPEKKEEAKSVKRMAVDSPPRMSAPRPAPAAGLLAFEASDEGAANPISQEPAEAKPVASKEKNGHKGQEGAPASIAIKPWNPQSPYIESLRKAPSGKVYEVYLKEKAMHASPAFFLDCAEYFFRLGNKALGLRVLSNLAELRLDDPGLLRVLAWRLFQAGELQYSREVLEKVLRIRPEEPQSKRDLALVLADEAESLGQTAGIQKAVDLLYEVVLEESSRFPEIELIALMELNRIIARAERRGGSGKLRWDRIDKRLRKLLDTDLRISLSWDADLTDVDLHVFEPTGEHAFYGQRATQMGGLVSHDITQGYGPEEYVVKKALPGRYAIQVHYYGSHQQTLVGPATITATVSTNWGRPNEKREVLTLRLQDPKEMEEVGVVTIGAE